MITTTRISITARIAVLVASVACAALLSGAVVAGAATVSYQHESLKEYEQQLAGGQIQAVTINKRIRSLRVTLKDGRYVLARYPPKQEPKVAAALQAKHVAVTLLTPAEALKEAKAIPVHHKLRYIAGGVVIVVIALIVAMLLLRRRRERE